MSPISPTDDERICAWHDCQTEEFLRDLFDRFGASSPRQCWNAFFADCSLPAPQSLCDSLAVPVGAVQGVSTLPDLIPPSETLWRFLTNGYGYAYVAALGDRDKHELMARAQRNWDRIRAEAVQEVCSRLGFVVPFPSEDKGIDREAYSAAVLDLAALLSEEGQIFDLLVFGLRQVASDSVAQHRGELDNLVEGCISHMRRFYGVAAQDVSELNSVHSSSFA